MSAADDLEDLLAKERQIILEGRIKELQALGVQKLVLLNAVRAGANTPAEQLVMTNDNCSTQCLTSFRVWSRHKSCDQANNGRKNARAASFLWTEWRTQTDAPSARPAGTKTIKFSNF